MNFSHRMLAHLSIGVMVVGMVSVVAAAPIPEGNSLMYSYIHMRRDSTPSNRVVTFVRRILWVKDVGIVHLKVRMAIPSYSMSPKRLIVSLW